MKNTRKFQTRLATALTLLAVAGPATAAGEPALRAGEAASVDGLAPARTLLARADAAAVALALPAWQRQRPGAPEPEPVAAIAGTVYPEVRPRSYPRLIGRHRFEQAVAKAARDAGIDPALVHAVIRVESAYNPAAVSPKGALGLMQVIPSTGRRFGVDDLLDPYANLRAGTGYLSHLMRLFGGDLPLVLAAYNAGEHAVIRHGRRIPPYRETMLYVPRVLSVYGALAAQAPAP